MKIAIIPARGGSKRIPKKNIKLFSGAPMISYPIKAAISSLLFDHIIVSTDCKNIKSVAEKYGAKAPFIRPECLSDDYAGTGAVVNHAINWFKQYVAEPDLVCCIYPTSPFLRRSDLNEGLIRLNNDPTKSFSFSVARYAFPIQRALTFDGNDNLSMLFPVHAGTRSQDLKEVFHDAGQFYWGRTQAFLNNTPTFGPDSIPVFLPRNRVMDIDDEEDWQEAELMYELLQMKGLV